MKTSSSRHEIQLVTFLLDGQGYCVDVMSVREIICMTDITKTTTAAQYVEGIINLRGTIVPIISLRKRFGMADTAHDINTCIAIMDLAGQLTGFIVDEVEDVIRVKREQIQPPAEAVEQEWMEGIVYLDQKIVMVMNPEHLA